MSNVFLTGDHSEIETAILLSNAMQCDLGKISPSYKGAVAFTDGKRVYINDDDHLAEILPDYNTGMLKWLLWHERYHMELKHHNRFFRYLEELKEEDCMDEFHVTKEEVNIIMDILVHDSLSKMFPELVETAVNNLAQMRNRNSLGYTFKSHNLEDMLDEYAKQKHGDDKGESKGEPKEGEDGEGESEGIGDTKSGTSKKDTGDKKDKGEGEGKDKGTKGHASGGSGHSSTGEDKEPEVKDEAPAPTPDEPSEPEPEHDKTDWSKLDGMNTKEFISESEGERISDAVEALKRRKFKLGILTQTLNGLATTTKERTYTVPSYMNLSKGIIMKGKRPGKTALYLCFDASGSMGEELELFKEIISKSIPHAMKVPCEWFAGYSASIEPYKMDRGDGYYKGTFADIMKTYANSGYDDDGDRTIELCWKAEQEGFSPIGITDGGGSISWSKDKLKELKRTVFVGQNKKWLEKAKEINPRIQIIDI